MAQRRVLRMFFCSRAKKLHRRVVTGRRDLPHRALETEPHLARGDELPRPELAASIAGNHAAADWRRASVSDGVGLGVDCQRGLHAIADGVADDPVGAGDLQLVSDEAVAELQIVGVHIQRGVGEVSIVELTLADGAVLLSVESLPGEAEHLEGHRDGHSVGGQVEDQWVDQYGDPRAPPK